MTLFDKYLQQHTAEVVEGIDVLKHAAFAPAHFAQANQVLQELSTECRYYCIK